MDILREAYIKSIEILHLCSTKHGFYAAYPGYDMVFARDSMITSLGASLLNDKELKETFKRSLITLAENQSKKGQIPNAVDKYSKRKHHTDFMSIDSSLWFIVGNYTYEERYHDNSLLKKYKQNIEKALAWLDYQDSGEDGMPEQLPTTDWQDAFPHRYGHTINTQALYYKVLKLTGKKQQAAKLKKIANKNKELCLWNGEFYLPWRWKNHNAFHEKGEWFDTLGNLLAIIFDLADANKAKKILSHIKEKKIAEPYPIKAIFPPIKKGTKDWQDYFLDCAARTPYHYLNAGIWTYIGGFYVLALIKLKKYEEAKAQLKKLAEANFQKPYFSEWLNGKTGIPGTEQKEKKSSLFSQLFMKKVSSTNYEGNQGWNAGMYILAYESLKKRKCLI